MNEFTQNDSSAVLEMVIRERRLAVSDNEWQHRLRGYGYGIRDTAEGRVLTSLLRGASICNLPANLAV